MKARFRTISSKGFVLIEVLFAMFLICAGALIVAATMPLSNVARNKAQLADKAMDVAQKQMEAIRANGFANATPSQLQSLGLIDTATPSGDGSYPFTNSDSANLDNPAKILPSGSGSVTLTNININLVRITVSVSYSDRGTTRNYTIGTLEANL